MSTQKRLGQLLNQALHDVMEKDPAVYVLGEDIRDPYGGAFGITAGLSSAFSTRTISTPISEAALVGIANGLALAGDAAVVELMFGDFVMLAMDQIVNMGSKLVSMYGQPIPLRLVVRCPVGGRRGYGATHSQSPQRHLLGVPDLRLFELSPVHPPGRMLSDCLEGGTPAVLFEDKVLYGQRFVVDSDQIAVTGPAGPAHWVRLRIGRGEPDGTVVCAGGMTHRAIEAAKLRRQAGFTTQVLVPAQIHPLTVEGIRSWIPDGAPLVVADDGAGPHGWGIHVCELLMRSLWARLSAPPVHLSAAETAIPAARHLEDRVFVQASDIANALHAGEEA